MPIFVANTTNTMIKINNLERTDSVFNQYMAELRDAVIQQDRMRFRRNLERIGEVMAYEISKSFEYDDEEVTTPLGIKQIRTMHEQPVIATILRAGLPFHNGMLSMFDQADSAFIAAYRKYDKNEEDSEIRVEYFSSPDIEDRILILCDPLLATGESEWFDGGYDAQRGTYCCCRSFAGRSRLCGAYYVAPARHHLGGQYRRGTDGSRIRRSGHRRCG